LLVEVTEDLFFVQRGWLNGNHFVWRGAEPVLIDAAYLSGLGETLDVLGRLGVKPEAVSRIILTHVHCDHVGAVPAIQAASGCRVALHRISAHHIQNRDDWATWWRYYDQEAGFFEVHDVFDEGDVLEVGPHRFQVIHAPGHAAGQVALFEPEERILFSADALWEDGLGALTPRIEGVDCAYRALASLDKLAALKPRMVYPGHGRPFDQVEAALAQARQKLERFIAQPKLQGRDQLKKIIIFTLLMKGGLPAAALFDGLAETPWFGETVAYFFGQTRPRPVFDGVISELLKKGILQADGAILSATVAA